MATPNHSNINLMYGAPFIGLLVASFMSGVVTVQAFLYYRAYRKDPVSLKALVAFIWLLDLVHLITITHFVYYRIITHWGDVSVLNRLMWSWGLELLLNTLIMFTCQIFLTYRFKVISEGNWWITSVLVFFALVQLVFGVYSAASGFTEKLTPTTISELPSTATGCTWLFSGALDDVLIALSLTYYLHTRSGTKSTLIDRLIIYISSTGALTRHDYSRTSRDRYTFLLSIFSVIAIANVVTYLALPGIFVDLALNFPLGRIYTISLLSSLNMRQRLRESDMMPTLSHSDMSMMATMDPGTGQEQAIKRPRYL